MNDAETTERYQQITRFFEQSIPFNAFLGLQVGCLKRGFAQVFLPYRQEFIGDLHRPAVHGGVIATVIDTAGGLATYTHLKLGDRLSTVDIRIDYLNPGLQQTLLVESKVIYFGNRIATVDSIAYQELDDERHPIATGKAVYNMRRIAAK